MFIAVDGVYWEKTTGFVVMLEVRVNPVTFRTTLSLYCTVPLIIIKGWSCVALFTAYCIVPQQMSCWRLRTLHPLPPPKAVKSVTLNLRWVELMK